MDSAIYNAANIEKDCGALGGLFQQIINEMKASSPVWEDFLNKATKLHAALRTTVVATTAFLDAFQKVADLATNTKGATKEIGSSLTRLCIRHRSIEKKLKEFTNAILEAMVLPLQDKKEDWKARVMHLDKEHAKEYKKARAEIKKASSDTMKLQKKLKKGKSDIQGQLSAAMQDVTDKYLLLEETEKNSVRQALMEQRGHFCQFLYALKPVVDGEITMLTEATHLQEILDTLCQQSGDPQTLPPSSEQVILDVKGSDSQTSYSYQTPPSSPSSLGSRKSSMCSINSLNSNSSGSTHNNSPSHHIRHRPASQPLPPSAVRLSSVSSQDSGFTSQDALFLRPPSPSLLDFRRKSSAQDGSGSSGTGTDSGGTTPSPSYPVPPSAAVSTWANWPDPPYAVKQDGQERPHTISTAYEKSQTRPALSADLFQPPEGAKGEEKGHAQTAPPTPNPYAVPCVVPGAQGILRQKSAPDGRPPTVPPPPLLGPKPRAKPVAAPIVPEGARRESFRKSSGPPPVYVNTRELTTIPGGIEDGGTLDGGDEPPKGTPASDQSHDFMDLNTAMQHLNSCTAALEESLTDNEPSPADNRLSMSSGYATMSNTPTASEGTLATEVDQSSDNDLDKTLTSPTDDFVDEFARFSTLPRVRNKDISQSFRLPSMQKRPLSMTGGMPVVTSGTATVRRASMQSSSRPPPPVRRNSSITAGIPVVPPNVPKLPGHDGQHRRSQSEAPITRKPLVRSLSGDSTTPTLNPEANGGKSDKGGGTNVGEEAGEGAVKFEMSGESSDGDSVDDLPLPPPPEELMQPGATYSTPIARADTEWETQRKSGGDTSLRRQSSSIVSTHSEIMNTLNQKLGTKKPQSAPALQQTGGHGGDQPIYAVPQLPGSQPPATNSTASQPPPDYTIPTTYSQSTPIYATPYAQMAAQYKAAGIPPGQQQHPSHAVNNHQNSQYSVPPPQYHPPPQYGQHQAPVNNMYRAMESPDSTDDVTPTSEAPPNTFLCQIARGVRLRKTISNDRSAPKFT